MFNYVNPTLYMSRTSWDGALYLLSKSSSNYASSVLTAVDNGDGTWSFTITDEAEDESSEDVVYYMAIPSGTDNLNCNVTTPAYWTATAGDFDGYYYLTAGEGNNSFCIGKNLHLNSGGQYFVISESSNTWYPDFYGGVKTDENGDEITDENGDAYMADSTSMNWAFLELSNLSLYDAMMSAYTDIQNIEDNYLAIEGYETGFQNAIDAATVVYNYEDFQEEDAETISTLMDAYVALYDGIVAAIAVNTEGDAALSNAITTATNIFNSSTNVDDLTNAKTTLSEAVTNYQMGTGDMTNLGQNMSFEDLSAQDGSTTTGIGNPPTGWNMYINGTQVTTAEEISAAGISNWCGVNADCSGAVAGSYAFGVWSSSMPEFEISQTITGLENGTYTISAGLMVGANSNGSRRTTQRIFGNLNSEYWGSQSEYDETKLDISEVYDFAGLTEEVTDTELQEISVRAYVYDGTLTFGFRTNGNVAAALRSSSNSSGGDGWFKLDNFKIQSEGYIAADAVAIPMNYMDALEEYTSNYAISSALDSKIDSLKNLYSGLTEESSQEDIYAAIMALKDMTVSTKECAEAYQDLAEALDAAYINIETYSNYAGADDYGEVIMEIEALYDERAYDTEGCAEAIAELEAALETCIRSGVAVGIYVTDLITNPSFEDQSSQDNSDSSGVTAAPKGWTLTLNGTECSTASEINAQGVTGWCAINSGDAINVELEDGSVVTQQPTNGSKLWGIWNANMPEVELSQTITGLPEGTYILTADVMVQYNWAGNNITTQRIFANNYVTMFASEEAYTGSFASLPDDVRNADIYNTVKGDVDLLHLNYAGYTCESGDATTDLLRTLTLTFGVDSTGIAKIGFRTNGVNPQGLTYSEGGINGQGWFKVDNFTLYYESEEIPTSIEDEAVSEESFKEIKSRKFYTIDGIEIPEAQKGFNIVKYIMNDGSIKSTKTIVK